jgi:hypothetical protein
VSAATFEPFKAELLALREKLGNVSKKTVRDEELLERFRTLFRTWVTSVQPSLEPLLGNKRDFLKLQAELEALASLTAKCMPVADYRRRLQRAIQLANGLVLYLPPSKSLEPVVGTRRPMFRDGLFVAGIPDLPLNLVPNALMGWKSEIEAFVVKYPFDQSVFIMIRYRRRNETLITRVKKSLNGLGYNAILAADHNLTDDLYNPIACLLCCARGLAVFDAPEAGQVFNPNVAYELGMMHLLGRDCKILKHEALKVLHTDILMKLYVPFGSEKDIDAHLRTWLENAREQ